MNEIKNIKSISIDRIFLDLENPRHEPYENQSKVIEYLCREENVYRLARDIAKIGLNPLDLFALIPEKGRKESFISVEGNRRMCAIKLLNDPDLAPSNLQKTFQVLSKNASKINKINGIIFKNREAVHAWLLRIHGGAQNGIGRRSWDPNQKTRHIGDRKNGLALAVLDYAQKRGLITPQDRKKKITTVQRYLGNPVLREAIGLSGRNINDIRRNLPEHDFDLLLEKFLTDLLQRTVNSRAKAAKIIEYARKLRMTPGLTGERIKPESLLLSGSTNPGKKKRKKTPKKPKKPENITYEGEIHSKLREIPYSYKLERLYCSITDIDLETHTPLLCIGVWAFFECLTAKAGRKDKTPFSNFLCESKLQSMGFSKREDKNPITQAVKRIADYGNTTKHHETAGTFNGIQLYNDMDTLKELIIKLVEEAQQEKS